MTALLCSPSWIKLPSKGRAVSLDHPNHTKQTKFPLSSIFHSHEELHHYKVAMAITRSQTGSLPFQRRKKMHRRASAKLHGSYWICCKDSAQNYTSVVYCWRCSHYTINCLDVSACIQNLEIRSVIADLKQCFTYSDRSAAGAYVARRRVFIE
jgi:hypothetical protein